MKGFLPATKSFYGDVKVCAWKGAQHRIHKVKSISGLAGTKGIRIHDIVAEIRRRNLSLEEFGSEPGPHMGTEPWTDDEQTEIIDMVHRAFTSDAACLSEEELGRAAIEEYFMLDVDGRLTSDRSKAFWSGITDRDVLRDDGTVLTDDLKTGWRKDPSPLERAAYIAAAMARHPEATKFRFGYHYLRSGEYEDYWYELRRDGDDIVVLEVGTDKEILEWRSTENPLIAYLKSVVNEISAMPEEPNPGPHCESWYGTPCQFLANGCPAGADVPAVIDAEVTAGGPEVSSSEMLRSIADNPDFVLTSEIAAWALAGTMQLKGFTKRVEDAVKEFSKAHGPIMVGGTKYSWFTTQEAKVNKPFALREMINVMGFEEAAEAINLSRTTIAAISKRKYPDLRELLLDFAVEETEGKPRFGAIKNETEE